MMQTETWIDKTDWGNGPWQHEPDRVEWRIGVFVALALRNDSGGNWCGYVGVPEDHSWYGRTNSCYEEGCPGENYEVDECIHQLPASIEVHGGVTFADTCQSMPEGADHREYICHLPQFGEFDRIWWVGFDCAHCRDFTPGRAARERVRAAELRAKGDLAAASLFGGPRPTDEVYRPLGYVQGQILDLVHQAMQR